MAKKYRIVALPGEGIGLEVVPASLKILEKLAQIKGFDLKIDYGLIGETALQQLGSYFPEVTKKLCTGADGIVFGAVTKGGLLELRQYFDLFINLRPITIFPCLISKSPLKPEKLRGVDILFVRELVSGIYFGASGRDTDKQGIYGYHTMQYYDDQIRRIARVALKKAENRQGLLTIAHKENALPHIPWTRLVQEEALNFPTVSINPMLADNLAMQLILNPQNFDVILAGNLFGDILSDLGGALIGSIGLLGSASLNEQGFGLYEPVHGIAPNLANLGIANPLGTIMSIIMMLEQWQEIEGVTILKEITAKILTEGYRTFDLNPTDQEILVNTEELITIFLKELNQI